MAVQSVKMVTKKGVETHLKRRIEEEVREEDKSRVCVCVCVCLCVGVGVVWSFGVVISHLVWSFLFYNISCIAYSSELYKENDELRKKKKYYFINSSTFFDARFNVLIHKFIISSVSARHLSDLGTA